MSQSKPTNFEEYIAPFPAAIQERLHQMRHTIITAVPEVEETIGYGMPQFRLNGVSVWIAGYKRHIGMYPLYGTQAFREEMEPYKAKGTKDSLHFLHKHDLPLELIGKWVKHKLTNTK